MSDSELIYELEADPPPAEKFFAAQIGRASCRERV